MELNVHEVEVGDEIEFNYFAFRTDDDSQKRLTVSDIRPGYRDPVFEIVCENGETPLGHKREVVIEVIPDGKASPFVYSVTSKTEMIGYLR